jgi:hypothetical protein
MRRVIRLYEAPVIVTKWDLCAALAIVAAFVVVLTIVFGSMFARHRTQLSVSKDFGLSEISDLSRR